MESQNVNLENLSIATGKQKPKLLDFDPVGTTRFGRFKFKNTGNSYGYISKRVIDLLGYENISLFVSEKGIFSNRGETFSISWIKDGFRHAETITGTGDIYNNTRIVVECIKNGYNPTVQTEPQRTEPEPEPVILEPEPVKSKYYVVPSDWNGKHYLYDKVLTLLKNRLNVYLFGDAGTGKNVMAEQIAATLGIEFYMIGKVTDVYTGINGFRDANGVYHETALYKAIETGGVFFFDEVDSSDPEALIKINALLANGYIDFPTGRKHINPDKPVYFILAGNTCGNGSTGVYIRQKLDGASLNRMVKLNMDYDQNIEYSVSGNKPEIAHLIRKIREYGRENEIEMVCGTRDISQIKIMRENGFTQNEALNATCLATLSDDDKTMIYREFRDHDYFL